MSKMKKLLLVEDEPLIAMMETMELEKYGYNVKHIDSGESAVEYTRANYNEIDLILMDIDLGDGIDGTEAAKQILSEYHIPVVFLSSHVEPEIVEKTEKITSYGYVVKNSPITILDTSIKMAFKLFYEKQKIEEKEEELEQVLEATTDGIWTWNFSTNTLFFSDNYYKMLGYEPEAFPATYDSWVSLIHPEDLDSALKVAREYLKTKPDNYRNSFRLRKNDGSYISVICNSKVVKRDSSGNALYMIGNHTDVTNEVILKKELNKVNFELNERVKELKCLYQSSQILEDREKNLHQKFKDLVNTIPKGWQYPEEAYCSLIIDGDIYKSNNYLETHYQERREILVEGRIRGKLVLSPHKY